MGKAGKKKLTPKQALFIKEYLVDLNASAAARRAGYSPKTAFRAGQENMQKPAIQAAIKHELDKKTNSLDITIDRVLRERAKLAFYNALELFQPNGAMKPITEIHPDLAAAIGGLDIHAAIGEDDEGNPKPAQILKFRLPDKNKALDALDKYLGLYKEDNAQRGQVDQEARQEFMRDLFQTISQANGRGLPEPRE